MTNDSLNEHSEDDSNAGNNVREQTGYFYLTKETSPSDCMKVLGFSHDKPEEYKSFEVFLTKVLLT
jgi:hypothetical protein